MRARVTVYPRPEILDPQGKAILQTLQRVGFESVRKVRAGKSFDLELDVEDRAQAQELLKGMCEKLLANTVVEDYSLELEPESAS